MYNYVIPGAGKLNPSATTSSPSKLAFPAALRDHAMTRKSGNKLLLAPKDIDSLKVNNA